MLKPWWTQDEVPFDTGISHDDVIRWKHFRVTGPFCGKFTGDRWILLTKDVLLPHPNTWWRWQFESLNYGGNLNFHFKELGIIQITSLWLRIWHWLMKNESRHDRTSGCRNRQCPVLPVPTKLTSWQCSVFQWTCSGLPYGNKIPGEAIRIGDGLCGEAAGQAVDMDTLSAWLTPSWGELFRGPWISLTKARNVVPWYFLCCQFEEAIKNSWDAGDFRRHDTLVTSM